MRIDDIDALLATVQFSSLNQAAEYLGITQSAITRRLQRLEQELNVTLLERQTRPLTLTAAGHRVYEQCLSIKRETKKLYSLLDPQGEPRGALRLGVPQSLSEIALPAALSALSQQFPGLSPQITCGWSGQLQRRLENGELDVTLLGQGFTWLDTGTHESLVEATNFVKTVETHQHRKIACLEEIAYLNGWITKEQVLETYEELKKNQYGRYLKDVLDGKYIDKLHGNDMK